MVIEKINYNDAYDVFNLGIFKIKHKNIAKILNLFRKEYAQNRFEDYRKFIFAVDDKLTNRDKILYVSKLFYESLGYYPNLKNPRSFNEKINWLKLNYHNPIENKIIDKYEFKNWVKEKLGDRYTVPLLGVYEDVNDIDFEKLPQKFVLKTTMGAGSRDVFIVKNKSKADIDNLKYQLSYYQQYYLNSYNFSLARGNKGVQSRILVEEYLEELSDDVSDFKFFCFNGKVKCFYIANNWAKFLNRKTLAYYDMNGDRLPFRYDRHHLRNEKKYVPTKNFKKMVEIAEKLSQGFPFVRVDMYDLKDKIYVGELTFCPGAGLGVYDPVDWDYKLGEWLNLEKIPDEYLNIMPELQNPCGSRERERESNN